MSPLAQTPDIYFAYTDLKPEVDTFTLEKERGI